MVRHHSRARPDRHRGRPGIEYGCNDNNGSKYQAGGRPGKRGDGSVNPGQRGHAPPGGIHRPGILPGLAVLHLHTPGRHVHRRPAGRIILLPAEQQDVPPGPADPARQPVQHQTCPDLRRADHDHIVRLEDRRQLPGKLRAVYYCAVRRAGRRGCDCDIGLGTGVEPVNPASGSGCVDTDCRVRQPGNQSRICILLRDKKVRGLHDTHGSDDGRGRRHYRNTHTTVNQGRNTLAINVSQPASCLRRTGKIRWNDPEHREVCYLAGKAASHAQRET